KSPHLTMQWHEWVVLIAGSTGFALRLFALPTFTSRHTVARSRSRRERGWFLVVLAPGHHGPCHSGDLVSERDCRDLGGRRRPRSEGSLSRVRRRTAHQSAHRTTAIPPIGAAPRIVISPSRIRHEACEELSWGGASRACCAILRIHLGNLLHAFVIDFRTPVRIVTHR